MKLHNLYCFCILLFTTHTLICSPTLYQGGSWLFMQSPDDQQRAVRAGEDPEKVNLELYSREAIGITQPHSLPMSTTLVYANRDEKGDYERAVIVRISPLGKTEDSGAAKTGTAKTGAAKSGAAKDVAKPEEFQTYAVSFAEIPTFHARSFRTEKEAQKFAYEMLSQKTPKVAPTAKKKLKDRKTAQAWRRAV